MEYSRTCVYSNLWIRPYPEACDTYNSTRSIVLRISYYEFEDSDRVSFWMSRGFRLLRQLYSEYLSVGRQ
jgi:hypothetical protein